MVVRHVSDNHTGMDFKKYHRGLIDNGKLKKLSKQQKRFPSYLRAKTQEMLTLFWTDRLPIIQSVSPAKIAAEVILSVVERVEETWDGDEAEEHGRQQYQSRKGQPRITVVEFCSGAGGPIPAINGIVNSRRLRPTSNENDDDNQLNRKRPVNFILTDLHPNVPVWRTVAKASSDHVGYVPVSIDATRVDHEAINRAIDGLALKRKCHQLLSSKSVQEEEGEEGEEVAESRKIVRLFCLSFHHFDDELAKKVLNDSMENSDAFV